MPSRHKPYPLNIGDAHRIDYYHSSANPGLLSTMCRLCCDHQHPLQPIVTSQNSTQDTAAGKCDIEDFSDPQYRPCADGLELPVWASPRVSDPSAAASLKDRNPPLSFCTTPLPAAPPTSEPSRCNQLYCSNGGVRAPPNGNRKKYADIYACNLSIFFCRRRRRRGDMKKMHSESREPGAFFYWPNSAPNYHLRPLQASQAPVFI